MCLPSKVKGSTIQTIAVVVGNLGNLLSLNFGLTFGITPAHSRLYASERTPLNCEITLEESTWVSGSLFLSAAVGSLVFGPVSSKIGPKSVMMLSGLMQITGWFCIHFAYDILHIYSSRIFAGVAAGAALTTLPLYISEITDCSRRNACLTVSIECWRSFGILVGFAMTSYLQYELIPIVGLFVSIVFTMTFPFIQESPFYYLRKGTTPGFEKSLRWFRGIRSIDARNSPDFEHELREIKHFFTEKCHIVTDTESSLGSMRLFFIGLIFIAGAQLNGVQVILWYGQEIFTTAGALKLQIDTAILILAAVQLAGSLLANWISGRVSRRILLFVTSLVSALCLISAIFYLSSGYEWSKDCDLEDWLLYALVVGHVLFASVGCFSLSTLILIENYPKRVRCRFVSLLHLISWLIGFVFIQFYQPLVEGVSATGLLLLFTIGCVSVTILSLSSFVKPLAIKEVQGDATEDTMKTGHFTNLHI